MKLSTNLKLPFNPLKKLLQLTFSDFHIKQK